MSLSQEQLEQLAQIERQFAQAVKIKKRRRRLGSDGFALGTMAIPSRHAKYPTRNSR